MQDSNLIISFEYDLMWNHKPNICLLENPLILWLAY